MPAVADRVSSSSLSSRSKINSVQKSKRVSRTEPQNCNHVSDARVLSSHRTRPQATLRLHAFLRGMRMFAVLSILHEHSRGVLRTPRATGCANVGGRLAANLYARLPPSSFPRQKLAYPEAFAGLPRLSKSAPKTHPTIGVLSLR